MSRINILPIWIFPDTIPSVYDTTSGTCIEMCAKVYGAMRELQKDYEVFVTELNKTIEEFKNSVTKDQEEFKNTITKIMHDYIIKIDEKMKMQDLDISNAIQYMKTNLPTTVHDLLLEMFESKELTIDFTYNETTESLDITGVVVAERSES